MKISQMTTRAGQACLFFITLECLLFWWYMQAFNLQAARLMFLNTGISSIVGVIAALLMIGDLAVNRKKVGWQNVAFGLTGFAYAAYVAGEVMWPTVLRTETPDAFPLIAGACAVLAVIALYKLDREYKIAPAVQKQAKHPWSLQRVGFTAMTLNIAPMGLVLFAALLGFALEGFWPKHGEWVMWTALVSGGLAVIFTAVMNITSWPCRSDTFWNGVGAFGLCLASIATWVLL